MESSDPRGSLATGWSGRRFLAIALTVTRAITLFLWLFLGLFLGAASCGGDWTGSVGAVFGKDNHDGRVYVREVPSDMAAAHAGLMVDDELVAIDGKPVRGMSADDVHQALSGKVGTKVRLQVRRGGELREVAVERGPLRGGGH